MVWIISDGCSAPVDVLGVKILLDDVPGFRTDQLLDVDDCILVPGVLRIEVECLRTFRGSSVVASCFLRYCCHQAISLYVVFIRIHCND